MSVHQGLIMLQREAVWNFKHYIRQFAFLSGKKNTQTEWSFWVSDALKNGSF